MIYFRLYDSLCIVIVILCFSWCTSSSSPVKIKGMQPDFRGTGVSCRVLLLRSFFSCGR